MTSTSRNLNEDPDGAFHTDKVDFIDATTILKGDRESDVFLSTATKVIDSRQRTRGAADHLGLDTRARFSPSRRRSTAPSLSPRAHGRRGLRRSLAARGK